MVWDWYPWWKVGVCLALFVATIVVITKNDYMNKSDQRQLLVKLDMSGRQALVARAVLVFWISLRLIFFGGRTQ